MAEKLCESRFRVIIVGGSVAGLTLANALSRKNIDFLVLETRDMVTTHIGAAVCLVSNGTRILDQMGMLDEISEATMPLKAFYTWRANGKLLRKLHTPEILQTRHGYPIGWIQRQNLLQILFNHIPEKEKVLLGKKFVKAESLPEGVIVHCSDGSSYKGDIIIGADGAHSSVRQSMWQHMRNNGLEQIIKKDTTEMTAQYSCVYGVSENVAGVEDGIAHRMLCKGFSTVLISGTDGLLYWFLVTKMDRKYKAPHIPRYTKDELEAHVGRYLEQEMAPNIRLKTIYDKTTSCHYTPLEEAMYEHWTWERFACLGDAIHKMTPTLGLGANAAVENAASLANCLASILESKTESDLSTEIIGSRLSSWASSRQIRTNAMCASSNIYTRIEALDTWRCKIIAFHVIPRLGDLIANIWSYFIVRSEGLDFIPLPETYSKPTMPFFTPEQKANASWWKYIPISDAYGLRLESISFYCLKKVCG